MKVKFYKCNICGKMVAVVKDSPGLMVCCGKPMTEVKAKEKDEMILEKHVPVYGRKNNKIIVNVGTKLHPATKEHHIEWVSLITNKGFQIKKVDEDEYMPKVEFNVDQDEEVKEISSYCNIHSLYTNCPDNAEDEEDDCGCTIGY